MSVDFILILLFPTLEVILRVRGTVRLSSNAGKHPSLNVIHKTVNTLLHLFPHKLRALEYLQVITDALLDTAIRIQLRRICSR